MKTRAFLLSSGIGFGLQLAMVVVGHFEPVIRQPGYAIGGMGFSLVAGLIYARMASGGWRDSLVGGAVSGGLCGLLGIAVSVALGDVPTMLLVMGTSASTVTGLIGGVAGRLLATRKT